MRWAVFSDNVFIQSLCGKCVSFLILHLGVRSQTRAVFLGQVNKATTNLYRQVCLARSDSHGQSTEIAGKGTRAKRHLDSGLYYKGSVLTFPVAMGKTVNVVGFRTKQIRVGMILTECCRWIGRKWKKDFKGWEDSVTSILSLVEKPNIWAVFNHPPTETYFKWRLCIMGDAAHASTPFQGAGAGMALKDAFILLSLLGSLQQSSDIESVFHAFDVVRRPRTQKFVTTSRA